MIENAQIHTLKLSDVGTGGVFGQVKKHFSTVNLLLSQAVQGIKISRHVLQ